ncbi:MAG: valine--tRNA ligase, partial [Verrucomicrobiaceae bacterium]
EKTVGFFSDLMQLLHPFMPFITEEIYHQLAERTDDLCVKQFGAAVPANNELIAQGTLLQDAISALRDARVKNNLKPKDPVTVSIQSDRNEQFGAIMAILGKQVNADVAFVQDAVPGSIAVVVGTDKFYITSEQAVDTSVQREQLLKDLEYHKGFLLSVEKKLSNERFVQNAKPKVVDVERKKASDAKEKIEALQKSIALLEQ